LERLMERYSDASLTDRSLFLIINILLFSVISYGPWADIDELGCMVNC